MNIPLNPKFSWLNSRWAAFPDPPVRWLWLLLAWAFREGWTKELMNGDRWCWRYLEKPQNWMNKYQNVEHLNVWWIKNDSIWWFHSTDWANRYLVFEFFLSYLQLLIRMWFSFLSLSNHWEKWQVFALQTRGKLTALQVEDQSTRVCDLFGSWHQRGWTLALDCVKGINTKNHDLILSLPSNLLGFLIKFPSKSGTGEDPCDTSKASSLRTCSHDDMSPAAQSATAALFAAAQDLCFAHASLMSELAPRTLNILLTERDSPSRCWDHR